MPARSSPEHDVEEDTIYAKEKFTYFWSMSGDVIHRHHEVQRAKLYILDETTFPLQKRRRCHEAKENKHQ